MPPRFGFAELPSTRLFAHAEWMIVSGEIIKLASLYAIQLGSTAEEISALARDCFNKALSLSRYEVGGLIFRPPRSSLMGALGLGVRFVAFADFAALRAVCLFEVLLVFAALMPSYV